MMRLLSLSLVVLTSCVTLPKVGPDVLKALEAKSGGYLSGDVAGLALPKVLNREDFVWDTRTSPDSRSVAVSRLGMKAFHLSVFGLEDVSKPRADVEVNALEFNVEALDWSPDGALVAVVSRDRTVRLFDAKTGALEGAWLTDEALTAVAFHPTKPVLAVASTKGLLTVLGYPQLSFIAEQRAHTDEVTGLAWSASELFSSSWDRSVGVWALSESTSDQAVARVRFEKKGGQAIVRSVLDGKASASLIVDQRVPVVAIRAALAQSVGIEVMQLTDSVSVQTALGTQVARVAKGRTLSFKGLAVRGVDVAICDACVPQEAQGVLGQAFLDRVEVATDELTQEYVLSKKAGAADVALTSSQTVVAARRFKLEGSVNDLSLDAAGTTLAVALSEAKGERTRDVYEREKKKELEPERQWDCAARLDAKSGEVLERLSGHRGVVSTAGISPDGKTVVSGGWDKKVVLHRASPQVELFGWAVRRVRFSRDGRFVTVAAWTPQNPLGDHQSDPAAVIYEAAYASPVIGP